MYLTCEWSPGFPPPPPHQAAAEIARRYDGRSAVSLIALAKHFHTGIGAMHNVLEEASAQGLVRAVREQYWIPKFPLHQNDKRSLR